MARRLSSILSLGSRHSDTSSDASRPRSSFYPSGPSGDHPPSATLTPHKSTPDLTLDMATRQSSFEHLQAMTRSPPTDASRLGPHFSPAMSTPLPGLEEDSPMSLPPPQIPRKPIPQQTGSPGGSRPQSRGATSGSRAASRDGSAPNSRAASPAKFRPLTPTGEQSLFSKRRSWMPGSRGRAESQSEIQNDEVEGQLGDESWIVTPQTQHRTRYDLAPLASFQKIPELWNDACDTYVFLHARECGRGPSFKVDSSLFASSRKLATAAYGSLTNGNNQRISEDAQRRQLLERTSDLRLDSTASPHLSQRGSSNRSSSTGGWSNHELLESGMRQRREISLCTPLPLRANLTEPNAQLHSDDVEAVVTMRNVFAFLAGQPLVATSKHPSIFSIFMEIAGILHRYEFTNFDGSTLGEEVVVAFGHYVTDFRLTDVRSSREKTIEAIVLGERMKYWPLYNEGFVHAIGKYESLVTLKGPKYHWISDIARKRMERAHLELYNRLRDVRIRLEDFDFPSMWAGIAQSKSSSDSKGIRFKAWRSAFGEMRSHVLSLYKDRYGSWPPKARSKKNNFEESGLNRLLLRELYTDFSDLYDALVDRTSLTTRHIEVPSNDGGEDADREPAARALRRILSEYDRSTPPVLPPIPFDTPRLPVTQDSKAQKKETGRKLQSSEINLALLKSYNREHGQDPVKSTPFIDAFTAFERRCARGKSVEEIIDLRVGQWIFLYAVLQALPLVVVDAPDLKYTQGVEYFLCEVPKGNYPWVQDGHLPKQSWYGISGGSGMVSLPADVVEHSVDGIYRRSHCWTAAAKWAGPAAVLADEGDTLYAQPSNEYTNPNSADIFRNPYHSYKVESPRIPFVTELQPPMMPAALDSPGSRPASPAGSASASPSRNRRDSLAMGLEHLPLPAGVSPTGSRPTSTFNPEMSFDKILAAGALATGAEGGKKTKKR